jgi:hypothetical protein
MQPVTSTISILSAGAFARVTYLTFSQTSNLGLLFATPIIEILLYRDQVT